MSSLRCRWLLLIGVIPCLFTFAARQALGDDAEATFRDVFGGRLKEVRESKSVDDDIALAGEFMKATASVQQSPALVELLRENAYQLTKEIPAGYGVAVEAMERLAADRPARRVDCLNKAAAVARKWHGAAPREQKSLAGARFLDVLCQLAAAVEEQGDHAAALDHWRKATVLASSLGSDRLGSIKAAAGLAQERAELSQRISLLRSKVQKDANDAVSALALVRCFVIEQDQPRSALPYLKLIRDETFKKMAPLAATELTQLSPAQWIELGDWYAGLSKEVNGPTKALMQKRAVAYYHAFVESPAAGKDKLATAKAQLSISHLDPQGVMVPRKPLPDSTGAATVERPGTPGGPVPSAAVIRLVDLKPTSALLPSGQAVAIDRAPAGVDEPVTSIEARMCREFLFAHAPSKVVYTLPAGAEEFTAIGYCDRRRDVEYQVLVDGQIAFSSQSNMVAIKVNIPQGARTLTLITNEGNGRDWKHTFWCFPRLRVKSPQQAGETVKLTELKPDSAEAFYHGLMVNNYHADRWPYLAMPISPCKEYVLAPPSAAIEYAIPAGVDRFTAVAYSISLGDGQFRVAVDGRTLFRATDVGVVPVDLPLPAGARKLTLIMDMASGDSQHGFWCFPRFHKQDPSTAAPQPAVAVRPVRNDGRIDLLATADVDHAASGIWSLRGRELATMRRNHAKMDFGWQVRGDYDFEFSFTRVTGQEGVLMYLPMAHTYTLISLGGWGNRFHGLHELDSGPGHANETTRPGRLQANRRYRAVAKVRFTGQDDASIEVKLDDQLVLNWAGSISRLRNTARGLSPTDIRAVGIGSNLNDVVFHEAWLHPQAGAEVRRVQRSPVSPGVLMGASFTEMVNGPGLLVGLRYTTTMYQERFKVLGSLQPVYLTPQGRAPGAAHGQPNGEPVEAAAKPGYAVGAIEVRHGHKIDGFRLQFMRLTPAGLNPNDSYWSDLQGGNGGRSTMLGTVGRPIVGFVGRAGTDIDALGLVYTPDGRLSVWQEARQAVIDPAPKPPDAKPDIPLPPGQPKKTFFGLPID